MLCRPFILILSLGIFLLTSCGPGPLGKGTTTASGAQNRSTNASGSGQASEMLNMNSDVGPLIENLSLLQSDYVAGKVSLADSKKFGEETLQLLATHWAKADGIAHLKLWQSIVDSLDPANELSQNWLAEKRQDSSSQALFRKGLKLQVFGLKVQDSEDIVRWARNFPEGIDSALEMFLPLLDNQENRELFMSHYAPYLTASTLPFESKNPANWWMFTLCWKQKVLDVVTMNKLGTLFEVLSLNSPFQNDLLHWEETKRAQFYLAKQIELKTTYDFEHDRFAMALQIFPALGGHWRIKVGDGLAQDNVEAKSTQVFELPKNFDHLLDLRIALNGLDQNNKTYSEHFEDYRTTLASILEHSESHVAGFRTLSQVVKQGYPLVVLGAGIYQLDVDSISGQSLILDPLAMIVGHGKNLKLEFSVIENLTLDLSGEKGSDVIISDARLNRGENARNEVTAVGSSYNTCQATGTSYQVIAGIAPAQQTEGGVGANGGELVIDGPSVFLGHSLVNLQGGMGGHGAQGLNAINCRNGVQELVKMRIGADVSEICSKSVSVCSGHGGDRECTDHIEYSKNTVSQSSETFDYSQISAGQGGNGGRPGHGGSAKILVFSQPELNLSRISIAIFEGTGGQGGAAGACGLGGSSETLRGKVGDDSSIYSAESSKGQITIQY